ncbi:MAG: alpha-amylase family glycosyl hydrolase [Bilifractor sp.]|jgi:cyclomaltodextrinase
MWAYETVFYQIYPLGFTGAPFENDGVLSHRIRKVTDWIPHLKKLGVGAVYFSPLFESDTHGYNTRDYRKIDVRLGTNDDFREIVSSLHEAGIRVIIDGVFNHVGRGFFAFRDVQENREGSPYLGWFHIDLNGNTPANDGFWYEGWEGNYDLVRLNLQNPEVIRYLMDSVRMWIRDFDIDGLRLDVAYLLDREFLKTLRRETTAEKEDFFLVGEIIHGDYNQIMNDEMCHSVTNYECYKGLYSAFNSMNLFEIIHSLLRQFGSDPWTLYRGKHLWSFADNHDVSRIASVLNNEKHLPLIYTMIFTMPGMPIIYYGSEWGAKADKSEGDPALRPCFGEPEWNDLTDHIASLARIFRSSPCLAYGDFRSVVLTNRQCVFERSSSADGSRLFTAVNADENPYTVRFDAGCGEMTDLLGGKKYRTADGIELPPYSSMVLKPEA